MRPRSSRRYKRRMRLCEMGRSGSCMTGLVVQGWTVWNRMAASKRGPTADSPEVLQEAVGKAVSRWVHACEYLMQTKVQHCSVQNPWEKPCVCVKRVVCSDVGVSFHIISMDQATYLWLSLKGLCVVISQKVVLHQQRRRCREH